MKTKRRAIALFRNPLADRATQRHNQVAWLRALCVLGERYVLRQPVARRPTPLQ